MDIFGDGGLYFEQHKNLRCGVASLHKWCHSTQDGQIWGITKNESGERRGEIDRSCSTTLSLPEIWSWRRRSRRHSKNSSRQFQVGLHIITSLQQRCGGPTSETELAAKAQNASSRPQDICFFRNTQKTTFMSARWSHSSFPR